MMVKLLSYSKATGEYEFGDKTELQDIIAYCARVSNPANQSNTRTLR